MKKQENIDTPRKPIKWENPELVKLNKAEQANGGNPYPG